MVKCPDQIDSSPSITSRSTDTAQSGPTVSVFDSSFVGLLICQVDTTKQDTVLSGSLLLGQQDSNGSLVLGMIAADRSLIFRSRRHDSETEPMSAP